MKNFLESFAVAFSMYSKIPMPRVTWTKENMKYCLCFFPLIGLAIGLADYGWFRLCLWRGWSGLLRAAVLTAIPVIISGGIHLDGFLDTSDAISSYREKDERLKILSDSHVGAFAVIAACVYFTLYLGVLSEAHLDDIPLIGLGFALSRAWSGLGVVTLQKAKTGGLVRTFSDAAENRKVASVMTVYLVLLAVLLILLDPVRGSVELILSALTYLYYRHMSYARFGGITGDLAGFFVEICELVTAAGVVLIG